MKVTNEIKETSFPKLMQSTGTERLFLVGDLTGNGYPYISLSNSDSGFFTNFNNLVEYNRKVVLEND
jgi:hypothetical protein